MVRLSPGGKEALDAFIAKITQEQKFPSFIFGVTTIDGEIYLKTGGNKVVNDPNSGTVDEDAVWWICSQTKMIVHLAALQLIERGLLNPSTPVSTLFPVLANPIILDDITAEESTYRPAKEEIKVAHLLNFSSGLYYPAMENIGAILPEAYTTTYGKEGVHDKFFEILKSSYPAVPLKFEPGTDFVYGFSSDVLGFVVEKVSGKTLDAYCKENIFVPLGMTASFYLTPELKERLVPLAYSDRQTGKFEPWADQLKLIERDPSKATCHMGGVGIYASLRDYLKLLQHLLQIHAGKAEKPILSRETVHQLFVSTLPALGAQHINELFAMIQPPITGVQWGTASGICTKDWPNKRRAGSAFWSGWAGTNHFIDPATGIGAVYGTQIGPSPAIDIGIQSAFFEFEEVLYRGLEG
ncbi:unnamed protein product [Cyclocybe aegerita]|uniref:Beta-lactamase-related domain-containing protein n=1 Tax=Cyclocybe aegerita TaxID=1973307 RepID=A0A8S0WSJ4_CYCAE|nr:unnamed protein product [Cyclocybe aegerita]